jgi:ribose-phosphate pyrophosphokinase
MYVFSGSASKNLTGKIIHCLGNRGYRLVDGDVYLHKFPSGEPYCQFKTNLRGADIFLVQSISYPANDNFMELCVMIDAAKRASAGRITVVTPFMGYLRQDRKTKSRTPITAKLAMNMLTAAGANRLIGIDYHCEQAQGFVDIPVDHLYAMPVFAKYIRENHNLKKVVIVSPDAGGIKRAEAFSRVLGVDFAFCAKKRTGDTTVEGQGLVGDVKGKIALIIDDMTESLGTIIEAASACSKAGAEDSFGLVTHPLLTEVGFKRYDTNQHTMIFNNLITTDSVDLKKDEPRITVLSVADLLAQAILCVHQNLSLSELFEIEGF